MYNKTTKGKYSDRGDDMKAFENMNEMKKFFYDLRMMISDTWNPTNAGYGEWWDYDEDKEMPVVANSPDAYTPRLDIVGTPRALFVAREVENNGEPSTIQMYDGIKDGKFMTFLSVGAPMSTMIREEDIVPIATWTFIEHDEEEDVDRWYVSEA